MSMLSGLLGQSVLLKFIIMKTLKYVLLVVFVSIMAISCTEEAVKPTYEDNPILIPPPPPPPK